MMETCATLFAGILTTMTDAYRYIAARPRSGRGSAPAPERTLRTGASSSQGFCLVVVLVLLVLAAIILALALNADK